MKTPTVLVLAATLAAIALISACNNYGGHDVCCSVGGSLSCMLPSECNSNGGSGVSTMCCATSGMGGCQCLPGMGGANCSVPVPCSPACQHGTCKHSVGCLCESGWWGEACNHECPCNGHGDCYMNGINGDDDDAGPVICQCFQGWTGTNCSVPATPLRL